MIGSHLDSQPTGGKFDGAYGVLAAFEVLEAIADAGIATRRPVEVVSWTNEEGSRFQPGAMGSGVFAGSYRLDITLETKDRGGLKLGDELARIAALAPTSVRAMADMRPAAYLEVHIEQGPLLEAAGVPIGIVGGIQGIRRFNIDFTGEETHAGTTPRSLRKDALVAAVDAITTLNREADAVGEALRFTVGTFAVSPNSPNTVPGPPALPSICGTPTMRPCHYSSRRSAQRSKRSRALTAALAMSREYRACCRRPSIRALSASSANRRLCCSIDFWS